MDTVAVDDFLGFLNSGGSPFHAVSYWKTLLLDAGFCELKGDGAWSLKKGGKYFVSRNGSALLVFRVGGQIAAGKTSFVMTAVHSDSPTLKLRPVSRIESDGCIQLGVETYSQASWQSWVDRGLGVAGKVICKTKNGVAERLVRIADPICIIPSLGVHILTPEERTLFLCDAEKHLRPVLCTEAERQLLCAEEEKHDPKAEEREGYVMVSCGSGEGRMPRPLIHRIATELDVLPSDIVDADLCLFDVTPARRCGIYSQWIESGRLDNLTSFWCAMRSIMQIDSDSSSDVAMSVAFDHEEVGSRSNTGADSSMMETWLRRMHQGLECLREEELSCIMSRSILVSADMAHAVHPSYADKHQAQHKPQINGGVVIKYNADTRYTTNALTSAVTRVLAEKCKVPIQDFVHPNGAFVVGTVGWHASSKLGVRAVDVGVPQWAMHSARETCGCLDVVRLEKLMECFFREFGKVTCE